MSTEARRSSEPADVVVPRAKKSVGSAAAPHPTAPVSRFIAWVDTLPMTGLWVYPGIALAMVAWGQAVLWASGNVPVGELDPTLAILAVYGPYGLMALAVGRRIADGALVAFWPATGWPDADRVVWRERFASAPAAWETAAFLVGGIGGLAALVAAPTSLLGPEDGRIATAVAYAPTFVLGYAMGAVGITILARWSWLVMRIHREASAIDPFDPGPVHAFSRLTVTSSLTLLLVVYYSLSANAAAQTGNVPSLVFLATATLLGAAAFVVPLWGMHDRLANQKEALLREVDRRTARVADELYAKVDAGDLATMDALDHAMAGLRAQHERIDRLPTWPWPPQLFRGFVSALVLPIVLFVLTRAVTVFLEG